MAINTHDSFKMLSHLARTHDQGHQKLVSLFLGISTGSQLAYLLGTRLSVIERVINFPVYHEFNIPKRKKGVRVIHSPDSSLMKIQRRLNEYLQLYYNTVRTTSSFGFIRNFDQQKRINIVGNAAMHVGKAKILQLDIKDFFTSISARAVKTLFSTGPFHFNEHVSTALALLTTYKKHLPTGAPTSPVISNLICIELDNQLMGIANSYGMTYTRYADDLTFSTDNEISEHQIQVITDAINKFGFSTNQKKQRVSTRSKRQVVTGLTVNDKVNIDRRFLKKTRAMIHDLHTNGLAKASSNHYNQDRISEEDQQRFLRKIDGRLNFISMVRGKDDVVYREMRRKRVESQPVM